MSTIFEAVRDVSCIQAARQLGIQYKMRGNFGWAFCPLHRETGHASMWLSDDRGWTCYGCHKGGDAVKLYQEYLHVSPYEAAKQLAKDAGIVVDSDGKWRSKRPSIKRETIKEYRKRERNNLKTLYAEQDTKCRELANKLGAAAWDNDEFVTALTNRSNIDEQLEILDSMSDMELRELIEERTRHD